MANLSGCSQVGSIYRIKRILNFGFIFVVAFVLWYSRTFIPSLYTDYTEGVNYRMSTPDNTGRHILHHPTTRSPSIRRNYDFVAFKKKPGWHFVDFPCHYQCEEHAASVTVHFTTNASDIVGAHAVFFSTGPFTLEEWEALQYYRNPGQIWIFATQEPASIVPDFLPPKVYRYKTYNWSFTFHSTSDIHGAYGWYTPYTQPLSTLHPLNWYKEKPKLAAWVSSRHCEGLGWNRTQFVIDLGKFIPIDMYGKCGNTTLRKNAAIAREQFKIYKFHLSLENSCCSEYLSEKVWNAFENWESVPIVIGGTKQEYERLAPPHSFIHADDFGSMKELADYIRKVSEDEHLYNEYFDWRNKGYVKQQSFEFRFPVFRQGVCKVVDRMEKIKIEDNDMFDPYGPDWFGSCYRCGEHGWIRNYTVWWRRTFFAKDWEDNRTLHWMDKETKQVVNSLTAERLSQH